MVSLIFLIAAFALGLSIDDPKARDEATQACVGWHINAAMGALVFTAFVHAVVLTYFTIEGSHFTTEFANDPRRRCRQEKPIGTGRRP